MKKYDITQCALYKCQSKIRLANLLLVSKDRLIELSDKLAYNSFEMPKKNSTDMRKIVAPNNNLKKVQKRILKLLQSVSRPEWLMSGEKGKSYITNAEFHRDSNYLLTMDIQRFYDNCKREYVYQFWRNVMQTSSDIAAILTDLTTYKIRTGDKYSSIPTGTPTGQMLAFYAYSRMFEEINILAKKHNLIFSLYVDDMAFSSKIDFSRKKLTYEVNRILHKYVHNAVGSKTNYYGKNSAKKITGAIITKENNLSIPNSLTKAVVDEFGLIVSEHSNATDGKAYERIIGRIGACRRINPNAFRGVELSVKRRYSKR